jgi:hypothetical protein
MPDTPPSKIALKASRCPGTVIILLMSPYMFLARYQQAVARRTHHAG